MKGNRDAVEQTGNSDELKRTEWKRSSRLDSLSVLCYVASIRTHCFIIRDGIMLCV